jgi:hypothetical protein
VGLSTTPRGTTTVRLLTIPGLLVALAVSAAGCFRAQARTVPEPPALDVPAPPPRLVEPILAAVPDPVPLAEEPPLNTPSPRPLATVQQRPETGKPEPPKVETPPDVSRPAEEAPRPAQTTLQTTPADREAAAIRDVRTLLTRSAADLSRVDYRVLSADARSQYDTAKRFASQADEALRAKNLVFASYLADKAATLAAQLAGR